MPTAIDSSDFAKRRTGPPDCQFELAVVLLSDSMLWRHGLRAHGRFTTTTEH